MLPASGEEGGALQRAVGAEVGGLKLAAISPAEAARQRRASCRVWPGVGGLKGQPAAGSAKPRAHPGSAKLPGGTRRAL